VRVSDRDAFAMARRLTREEGILAGESCGTAVVAALDEAHRVTAADPAGARNTVMVVILPDGGRNYLSKLYNDEWMRASGLLSTVGGLARVAALLGRRHHGPDIPNVVLARTTDRVGDSIELLQRFGISQMPVSQDSAGDALPGIVGSISERGLLERAYRNPSIVERTVGEVMDRPLPQIEIDASLDEAFALLAEDAPALLAVRGDRPVGVVSKLDILEHLAHGASPATSPHAGLAR
jgi:cystathionine beta-synthase